MTATPSPADERTSSSSTIAGFLSAMAIAAALIGIAWHPLRLIIPAMVLALISSAMAPKGNRLAQAAVAICAVSFFTGMLVAVVTDHPLW
jgi:hypothetical protein